MILLIYAEYQILMVVIVMTATRNLETRVYETVVYIDSCVRHVCIKQ